MSDVDTIVELIAKWEREANNADTNDVAAARRNCAYELREVIGADQPDEYQSDCGC